VLFETEQCEKFLQTHRTNLLQATAADIERYEEYRAATEGCRTRDTIRWRLRVGFTFLESHGLRSDHPVPRQNGGRATSLGDMGPAFEAYVAERQGCSAWRAHLMAVEAARLGSFLQRDRRLLNEATPEDVARYLDERCAERGEWARETVTGKLRPWFDFLQVHGLRADNPCGASYRPRRRPLGDRAVEVEAYLVEALGLSAGTARHVALEAERLGTFLHSRGRDVVQATLTDIEQYEAERFKGLKVGTRSAVVGNLRTLFRYLQTTGQRKDNPGEWLHHPRVDRLAQVPPVLESLRVERFLTKLARRRDGFAGAISPWRHCCTGRVCAAARSSG
jgi:site-specific recombinase XerD